MAWGAHPGTVIGGRYRLTRPLGAGGFGEVWEAHDPVLDVDVAMKMVRLGSVPDEARAELLARAARESRNAARLRDHPHIITVHDVVEADDAPWIVMQLVEGRSLADELRANGPLTLRRALDVAEALLSALGAAHDAGIMHRDVKLANVMLGENGDVLLTDFGIALAHTDPRLTRTTMVIGSPAYMAPERWQGASNDGRSDLFSLGVTLYEAVEGVPPFPPDNLTAALTETPRAPQRAGPLTPLLIGLLARNPADRPGVPQALAMLGRARRTGARSTEGRRSEPPPTLRATDERLQGAHDPSVRRLAAEHGVDVNSVKGTGTDGRVRVQDVIAAVKARHGAYATRAAREFAAQQGIDLAGVTGSGRHGLICIQDVKHPSTGKTGAGGVAVAVVCVVLLLVLLARLGN
ncbi:protein kinase [Streptomyces katrae]|uniref:non-specific serine/threonine protein kinase n=1 Tax=Streptomyces katrae TaxID=68223 RepID=A0ABT7GR74_9ACTN|nr:protein kinase [Streptomyces katrae]MDK9496090.1 protein kinase [Streptomyces katrae]